MEAPGIAPADRHATRRPGIRGGLLIVAATAGIAALAVHRLRDFPYPLDVRAALAGVATVVDATGPTALLVWAFLTFHLVAVARWLRRTTDLSIAEALAAAVVLLWGGAYVALLLLGPRWGLPVAGLFGGFVSSVATIAAMGRRSREDPDQLGGALAGAALSSVATALQLALVLAATDRATLSRFAAPLAAMAGVAILAGAYFGRRHLVEAVFDAPAGRAFDPRQALLFALVLATMLLAISVLGRLFGTGGLLAAAVLGGFLDTHSAAASIGSLASRGAVPEDAAATALALAISANAATKLGVAATAGRDFVLRLAPSLVAMIAALWLALLS